MSSIRASSAPYWLASTLAMMLLREFRDLIDGLRLWGGTRRYDDVTTLRPRSYTLPRRLMLGWAITMILGPDLHFLGSSPRSPGPRVMMGRMYPSLISLRRHVSRLILPISSFV